MKSIQDYCIRWTNRKGSNPLHSVIKEENIVKMLKGFHTNCRQSVLYEMEQSVELLKRAAKVLAKEGPPTNEDGKNERAKQIQDGKYLILRAVSLKTNICSASNAKKVDKKFGSMLRTFTATLEKLKFGKKKPKISLKCTEKDCPGKLKEKEVHIYYDVKCVN